VCAHGDVACAPVEGVEHDEKRAARRGVRRRRPKRTYASRAAST